VKLYEFDYTDNQKLGEADLHCRVEALLETECQAQGWAPGYIFRQCQKIERSPAGDLNYHFEVIGRYLDSDSVDMDSEVRTSDTPDDTQAAKDVSP